MRFPQVNRLKTGNLKKKIFSISRSESQLLSLSNFCFFLCFVAQVYYENL